MRELSDFFERLKFGFLSGITESVKGNPDLNLVIRDICTIVYHKGNSMLNLSEVGSSQYKALIDKKFLQGLNVPTFFTESNIGQFLTAIQLLKQNIIKHGKRSLEVEYEQMFNLAKMFVVASLHKKGWLQSGLVMIR